MTREALTSGRIRVDEQLPKTAVFNVVGANRRVEGLADIVTQGRDGVPVEVTGGEPEARNYRVTGHRFGTLTGWAPARTVADGVAEIRAWLAEPGHREEVPASTAAAVAQQLVTPAADGGTPLSRGELAQGNGVSHHGVSGWAGVDAVGGSGGGLLVRAGGVGEGFVEVDDGDIATGADPVVEDAALIVSPAVGLQVGEEYGGSHSWDVGAQNDFHSCRVGGIDELCQPVLQFQRGAVTQPQVVAALADDDGSDVGDLEHVTGEPGECGFAGDVMHRLDPRAGQQCVSPDTSVEDRER